MAAQQLTPEQLENILHSNVLRLVRLAMERDRRVQKGLCTPADATHDLRLDLEDLWEQGARDVNTFLVLNSHK